MEYYLAIDIGASSGRHVLGWMEHERICTQEIYRFPNQIQTIDGTLYWDTKALFTHILAGMKRCKELGKLPKSVGIDTWAVDYILLDETQQPLSEAICYRDRRTEGMDARLEAQLPFAQLYARTGIQKQPFNTIYQLMAEREQRPELLAQAKHLLLLPDYFHFLLTGVMVQEYTNATSTSLVHAQEKTWDWPLIEQLDLPKHLFLPLSLPGTSLGQLRAEIQAEVGFSCQVVLPATHDTASAYLGIPACDAQAAYLSSGTWSLLGTELTSPLLTPEAMQANFTNEGGWEFRYRFLKNIMGLWMIQSVRHELDDAYSFPELEELARAQADFLSVVDVHHQRFLAPKSMMQEIHAACCESGQAPPESIGAYVQCIYQSLAIGYHKSLSELEQITQQQYHTLHIVGGGAQAVYLNELVAQHTGRTILAGPAEGTILGNLLAQMLAQNVWTDTQQARACIRASFTLTEYKTEGEQPT